MLTNQALTFAQRRLEDFYAVHQHKTLEEKADAVNILLESFGLDDPMKAKFVQWLTNFAGEGSEGAVMLGLLLGCFANEYR